MFKIKGLFVESSSISKLMLLLGITCVFTTFALSAWMIFSPGDTTDSVSLKWGQLLQSIGMFVLPPIAFGYLCSEKTRAFLHFDRKINWHQVLLVVLFMVIIIPAINLLTNLNQHLVLPKTFAGLEAWMRNSEEQITKLTEQLLNVHTLPALAFNIFVVAMIPALGEELFFRGALQGIFRQKMNVKIAIWLTAIIFSAIHMQFYGFFPRMLLGAFFGYLLFWSESMWLPIVAHFTNNGIAVVFYYLQYNGYNVPNIDTIGTGTTLWLGIASGGLAIFGFFQIDKRFLRKNNGSITNRVGDIRKTN